MWKMNQKAYFWNTGIGSPKGKNMSAFKTAHAAPAPLNVEIDLSEVLHHLDKDEIRSAADQCALLSNVYSRNIGYLLISLGYLTEFNLSEARNYLGKMVITHPNPFTPLTNAKSTVEKVIKIVEQRLASSPFCLIFPHLIRNQVREELLFNQGLVHKKLEEAMDKIDSKVKGAKQYHTALLGGVKPANSENTSVQAVSNSLNIPPGKTHDDQGIFSFDD